MGFKCVAGAGALGDRVLYNLWPLATANEAEAHGPKLFHFPRGFAYFLSK